MAALLAKCRRDATLQINDLYSRWNVNSDVRPSDTVVHVLMNALFVKTERHSKSNSHRLHTVRIWKEVRYSEKEMDRKTNGGRGGGKRQGERREAGEDGMGGRGKGRGKGRG